MLQRAAATRTETLLLNQALRERRPHRPETTPSGLSEHERTQDPRPRHSGRYGRAFCRCVAPGRARRDRVGSSSLVRSLRRLGSHTDAAPAGIAAPHPLHAGREHRRARPSGWSRLQARAEDVEALVGAGLIEREANGMGLSAPYDAIRTTIAL